MLPSAIMAKRTPEKPMNPRAKGLKPVVVRLEPVQITALKVEALRRAQKIGSIRPDVSELVREAIAKWMKRR
jgi:hypothetical protein